jgi:hypothetical protein
VNELAILPPVALPACLADAEIRAAMSYAENEKSEGTRRAYRSDWKLFTAWCSERGLESLPASAATVARFVVTSDRRPEGQHHRSSRGGDRLRPPVVKLRTSDRRHVVAQSRSELWAG